MNQNYKISIIVPAYNVQDYIEKCINSILNQTYKNIEVIVVNDGSTDNTFDIINSFAKKDDRIKIINQENQGLSESRNNAMKMIKSEYVMFVDADDWIDKDTCEVAVNEIGDADIFWFSYVREYEKNSLPKSAFEEDRKIFSGEEIKTLLQRRIIGPIDSELKHPEKLDALSPVWGKLYKLNVIKDIAFKSFKEIGATCEDVFYNIEVLENVKKVIYINKNFYHYRKTNSNSLAKGMDKELYNKWKKAYFLLKRYVKNEVYENALNNRFSINIIAIGQRIVNSNNSFKVKFNMLKEIMCDEVYCNAIKSLNISEMPIHWKIFFWNIKKKQTLIVYFLIICIIKLAKIK